MEPDLETLKNLSELIRAEMERGQAEKAHLEETRRLRVAEERRARNLEDIVGRYAHLGEEVGQLAALLTLYIERDPTADILRESFEEFSLQVDHLERRVEQVVVLLRFVLGSRRLPAEEREQVQAVFEQLDREPQMAGLRRQITMLRRRQFKLLEQQAQHGPATAPGVVIEIEDVDGQIEALQAELKALEGGE